MPDKNTNRTKLEGRGEKPNSGAEKEKGYEREWKTRKREASVYVRVRVCVLRISFSNMACLSVLHHKQVKPCREKRICQIFFRAVRSLLDAWDEISFLYNALQT